MKDLPLTHKPIAQLATKYHSAFVHGRYSAANPGIPRTSLGYDDAIMSSSSKMLRPFEGGDEMVIFGVSTAKIFLPMQLMVRTTVWELRNF